MQIDVDPAFYELEAVRATANVPKVFVGPPYPNLYNCTTCRFGNEPVKTRGVGTTFVAHCSWKGKLQYGGRDNDIGCSAWRYDPNKYGVPKTNDRR